MPLSDVIGRVYGPFPTVVSPERTADLLAATGDDPGRWDGIAPPSYAAVLQFVAAPAFFADPDVVPYAGALIHADQAFTWSRPLALGDRLDVEGRVDGVRSRGPMHFVSFTVTTTGEAGPVLSSAATFVMSAGGDPADGVPDEPEPGALAKEADEPPGRRDLPPAGEPLPPLRKSASRADLVRYGAATSDFNPIHWDHEAARSAGLPGIIAHGLLMGSWAMQEASRFSPAAHPLAGIRMRFRRYLRPAVQAEVAGTVRAVDGSTAMLDLAVRADGTNLVTASAEVLTGG